jgi:hypothetical protein
VLKRALDEGIICKADFYNDEEYIVGKLETSDIEGVQGILGILKNPRLERINYAGGKKIVKKFRYLDPLVFVDGRLKRLTELSDEFARELVRHRTINSRGIYV